MYSKLFSCQVWFLYGVWLEAPEWNNSTKDGVSLQGHPPFILSISNSIKIAALHHSLAMHRYHQPRKLHSYLEDGTKFNNSKMTVASLSSKFYYVSVLFSVQFCSPFALCSPVRHRHPPACLSYEYMNKQSGKQEECALSRRWHMYNTKSKRKRIRDTYSF